jgi:subtilisin family serine protease
MPPAPPGQNYTPPNSQLAFPVGAIGQSNLIFDQSMRGPSLCGPARLFPQLVAPGVLVPVAAPGGGYAFRTGTSFAAPHAAGALALLLSAYPELNAGWQESLLAASAADLGPAGPDSTYGYGRLDALAAYNRGLLPRHYVFVPMVVK